jgi:hypothetical protein
MSSTHHVVDDEDLAAAGVEKPVDSGAADEAGAAGDERLAPGEVVQDQGQAGAPSTDERGWGRAA